MISRLKKTNIPLMLGGLILILLIFISLFPQWFTSKDPLYEEKPKYVQATDGSEKEEKFLINPMPPNKDNLFGTDDGGRDVFARIIYGTSNTLKLAFFAAVFRMIIALPIGISAGMGSKVMSKIIKIFNTIFTAIPILIFSFIVLNREYFKNLQMDKSIIAFTIVFTIVGWAKLAGIIEDYAKLVMNEDFIEGEVAIGKTKFQIAIQNILPHIIPTSISLFFKEMGMVLFLIAQLAILYVFVGLTRPIQELAFKANYEMNMEPEWGGILSRISQNIKAYDQVYWMTVYPIIVFSIAIIGINLTGEGLRVEFEKRDSKVISYMKKFGYILSPRVFISQIKNFKGNYKPVIIKTATVIIIIAYIAIPWHPSVNDFNLNDAKLYQKELMSEKYEGRVAGSEGGRLAGEYIINTLKSYGYQVNTEQIPLLNDTVIAQNKQNTYEESVKPLFIPTTIKSGWIKLKDEKGKEKTYELHKDFAIASTAEWVDEDPDGQINYKGIAATEQNAKKVPEGEDLFLIEKDYFNLYNVSVDENLTKITDSGEKLKYKLKIMLNDNYNLDTNPRTFDCTAIIPFNELKKDLEAGYKEIEINYDAPVLPKYDGRTITAFLPGKDKTIENPGETIIIGSTYDGVYNSKGEDSYAMTAAPAAVALSLSKELSLLKSPLEKSVEFIFWDNEFDQILYTNLDGSTDFSITKSKTVEMASNHGYYYFDIGYPGYTKDKDLIYISIPGQRVGKKVYLMSLEVENRLKELGINYEPLSNNYTTSKAIEMLKLNANTSVALGNPFLEVNSIFDNLNNENIENMDEMGQIILDTLTMNRYMMD